MASSWVALRGTAPAAGTDSQTITAADLVILPSGSAYVINHRLPGLSSDQTYQLWGMEQGRTVSLGLLGNHPTAVALTVGNRTLISAYAITAERAGGVVQSTHAPVALSGPERV